MCYSCTRLLFLRDANKTACELAAAVRAPNPSAKGAQLENSAQHLHL